MALKFCHPVAINQVRNTKYVCSLLFYYFSLAFDLIFTLKYKIEDGYLFFH